MDDKQSHHVLRRRTIKDARSAAAIRLNRFEELTESERRLLNVPITRILGDRRNIVRLSLERHHRQHAGARPDRLTRSELPEGLEDFAREYALEGALDRELRLIDREASGGE